MHGILRAAIGIALATGTYQATAVILSARGTGGVLIYPYYTVNHQQTLLSIVTTTEQGKALKVRFREGYDGRAGAGGGGGGGPGGGGGGAGGGAGAGGAGAAAGAAGGGAG